MCAGQRIAAPLGAATDNPHYRGPAAKIPDVRPRVLIIGSRGDFTAHNAVAMGIEVKGMTPAPR